MLFDPCLPWGYIDPNAGSILLQVVLAAMIGGTTYFFRPVWRLVRRVLGLRPSKLAADASKPPADDRNL